MAISHSVTANKSKYLSSLMKNKGHYVRAVKKNNKRIHINA